MQTNHKLALAALNRWKFKGWIVGVSALVSFAAGSLITAHLGQVNQVRADSRSNIRLNSAIGYVTPKDKLAAHQREIHTERDRKLAAARRQRQLRRQQAASLQANLCS